MSANWSLGLDTLRVQNADEDNWLSNGDEVYMVVIPFRAKLGLPGSAQTSTNTWATYDWAKHVSKGAVRHIPGNIGRTTFANVASFGVSQFLGAGHGSTNPAFKPEILGIVSLAFESDNTSWSSMHSIIDKAAPVVRAELEAVVANEMTPLDKLTAQQLTDKLKGSANHIKDAITPSVLAQIGLFLSSAGDPDDFIDFGINWFTNLDPELVVCFQQMKEAKDATMSGKAKPADQSTAALIARSGLHPLAPGGFQNLYDKSGVAYLVEGSVGHA
ncbi:hypothetical protein FSB78_08325 [Sphingomonas ginsenosidivorax]|uniref:Uncharacterized protein n=1 Tax=Sphingomonas ginsenosidivorax TaxID=862135 RepID=A0A5C6UEX7_9SPHN|nr:hypothetical protein [Sphingomonas ginsenosidivorax]TXC70950.1 hypothetical protein FSB78_08325 [Sphingomonas ginsenosidivorax]